jgi:dihydrolipoamide dehydrogenase
LKAGNIADRIKEAGFQEVIVAQEYDLAIIGGGPGGHAAAVYASQLGAKVALVERDQLGGACLTRGCIPTKTLARSAEALAEAKRAEEFGVEVSEIGVDFPKIMARKNRIVQTLINQINQSVKAKDITLFTGSGKLLSSRLVRVGEQEISAPKIIIATGSAPARIPVPGLELPGVLTSDDILELESIPSSLAIIGGGVIGVEFANIFSILGSKVTIIEMLPQILFPIDEEIARRFSTLLQGFGVEINTSATVKEVRSAGSLLEVVFATAEGERRVEAEKVLLTVGRLPYTEGLGLAELGINMEGEAIKVNSRMETNIEGVYAIGDVIDGIMLAHVASYEGKVAVDNAFGHHHEAEYGAIPNCIFTIPEIATVGMSEREAKEKGISYKVSRLPFSASARAQSMGETAGAIKMICEARSGRVIGVHILGPHASDLIAEATLAIHFEANAEDITSAIHAHPTLPEALHKVALGQLQ